MTRTTPTLDKQIALRLSRAYYNGLDRKGWSLGEEKQALKEIKQAVYAALVEQMPKLTLNEVIEAGLNPTKDEYDSMVWVDKWHKDKRLSVLSAVLGIGEEK